MKRLVCFLFLILLLGNLAFVSSETIPQLDAVASKVSDIKDKVDDLKNPNSQAYWEQQVGYLGVEFPKLLLKNPYIAAVDSFFQKISIVFRILFGMSYSLSLTLLFVIAFWFFFSFNFYGAIKATGLLNGGLNFISGMLVSVILAQTGFFKALVILCGTLIFAPKYSWMRFLVLVAIILAVIGVSYLDKKLAGYLKNKKGDSAKKEIETYQKAFLEREKSRADVKKSLDKLS